MSTINVLDLNGNSVETIDTPTLLQHKHNPILLKEVLEYHENKKRQNLAHVKTKNELSYSKKKRFKQKGTGRARAGNLKQSQHVHGVKLFGPNGRIYEYEIPRKKIQKGLAITLSNRFINGDLIVVNNLTLEKPKTKIFLEHAKILNVNNCIFLDDKIDINFQLSMGNVINMSSCTTNHINSLKILKRKKIVITKQALETLQRKIHG